MSVSANNVVLQVNFKNEVQTEKVKVLYNEYIGGINQIQDPTIDNKILKKIDAIIEQIGSKNKSNTKTLNDRIYDMNWISGFERQVQLYSDVYWAIEQLERFLIQLNQHSDIKINDILIENPNEFIENYKKIKESNESNESKESKENEEIIRFIYFVCNAPSNYKTIKIFTTLEPFFQQIIIPLVALFNKDITFPFFISWMEKNNIIPTMRHKRQNLQNIYKEIKIIADKIDKIEKIKELTFQTWIQYYLLAAKYVLLYQCLYDRNVYNYYNSGNKISITNYNTFVNVNSSNKPKEIFSPPNTNNIIKQLKNIT